MIYLDYSATTPVNEDVLESYNKVTKEYVGNANSIHFLGMKSKDLLMKATEQFSSILGCEPKEIIYTSGASESNSYALLGTAHKYKNRGKHIISSPLEHKSVRETLEHLSNEGFEIETVNILDNGQIDLNHLESIVRKDTILVSICAVNSEVGFKQPLKAIKQKINKKNENTIFHSDMTQALGKTKISLADVDLASFSAHKIYAPKGIGLLYKRKNLDIETQIFGTTDNTPQRGGTPALPLIVSFSKAVRLMNDNMPSNVKKVEKLKEKLINGLNNLDIVISSNELCVPHIVNISLVKIKSETFIHALERESIYIGTNSACSSLEESTVLKVLTNDKNITTTSIRVSISHLTKPSEIDEFINIFKKTYNELILK